MGHGLLAALRPTWLRATLLVPVMALLFLGSLDLHSDPREHSALDSEHLVYADAQHPDAPAHFETSRAETVPACAACLVQLQNFAGSLPAVAVTKRVPTLLAHHAGALRIPAASPRLCPLSRGPPQA